MTYTDLFTIFNLPFHLHPCLLLLTTPSFLVHSHSIWFSCDLISLFLSSSSTTEMVSSSQPGQLKCPMAQWLDGLWPKSGQPKCFHRIFADTIKRNTWFCGTMENEGNAGLGQAGKSRADRWKEKWNPNNTFQTPRGTLDLPIYINQ